MPYPVAAVRGKNFGRFQYWKYLRDLLGANALFLLPLWEASGTTAHDFSGNGYNCTAVNPTWAQTGIDENTSVTFAGNGVLKTFPAGVTNGFDGEDGFFSVWIKISTAVWEDASTDYLLQITAGSEQIWARKSATANLITCAHISASGGTSRSFNTSSISLTDFFSFTLTWGSNGMIAYVNGTAVGGPSAAIGAWQDGAPTTFLVAAVSTGPGSPFNGGMQYAAFGTKQLTPTEVSAIASPFQ